MALGQIDLAVTFSDDFASRTEIITFDVVQIPYQYNVILEEGVAAYGAAWSAGAEGGGGRRTELCGRTVEERRWARRQRGARSYACADRPSRRR